MKYIHDLDFRVHLPFNSDIPHEGKKAQLIAKYLTPHVKQQIKQWEKLVEDFMKLTIEELNDVFGKGKK